MTSTGFPRPPRPRSRLGAHALVVAAALAFGATPARPACAETPEDAETFVQHEHQRLVGLLQAPAGPGRDGELARALDEAIDFEELTRRAFGQPCPGATPACANHWAELNDAQRVEVRELVRRIVERSYKRNLQKTLDYEIAFRGQRALGGSEAKIRTEARSKARPRDPAVQVDYVVRPAGGRYRIVDVVTEGASLTKNYYDHFHRMLTSPGQGYPHVVRKLNEKLAKPG